MEYLKLKAIYKGTGAKDGEKCEILAFSASGSSAVCLFADGKLHNFPIHSLMVVGASALVGR